MDNETAESAQERTEKKVREDVYGLENEEDERQKLVCFKDREKNS